MNAVYALLLTAVAVQLSTFATSIYLHRGLTHRALHVHPLAAFVFRLQLWLATGIVPKEWVAVHRKHHRFADQEGDPHSPVLKGLWKILLGNVYYYARETRNEETLCRYAPDVGNDWLDRHIFRHGLLGLLVGLTLFVLLLGPLWGGPAFAVQAVVYIFLNAVINGAGHAVGYRTFDNTATNMWTVALITAGEGLHNNHHAFPTSARFSLRRYEFDPSWPVIRLLSALRLVRPLHLAPEVKPS
jgi:stearoyl-CoA desaturase (delta-9 desaturase)